MARSFGSAWRERTGSARWRVLGVAAVVVLASSLLAIRAASGPIEPRQAILVIVDTLRADALGCCGNPASPTPNLDRIAADGTRFENAIATSSWTLPSVASILTGTWPTIHGGRGAGQLLVPIRDDAATGAERLAGARIHTMAFANAAFFSPMLGLDRGFEIFDHRYTYNWNYRRADVTMDAVLKALSQHRSRRNFLVVHLFDPHLEYGAPAPFTFRYTNGRREPPPPLNLDVCERLHEDDLRSPGDGNVQYMRDVYAGEMSFVDDQVGRLVERLRGLGMYDESLLIVTADHGEEWWEHDGFEHGHTLYDELVHVPLIVKFPRGVAPAGKVVPSQVRLVDLMPTVFEWFGVEPPGTFVGESLLPLATGESAADREAFCEEVMYGPPKFALRGTRMMLILTMFQDRVLSEELYDWRADPGEKRDLARRLPEEAGRLRERLLALRSRLAEQARALSTPEPVDLNPRRVNMLRSLGYLK